MRPRYKMMAIDLDGTMLDPTNKVTPAVRDALQRAAAAGVTIVIATGRRYRNALPYARELGIDSDIIAQHGALIKEAGPTGATGGNRTIWKRLLSYDEAAAAVEAFTEEGLEPIVFVDAFDEGLDYFLLAGEPRRAGTVEYVSRHPGVYRTGTLSDIRGRDIVEVAAFDLPEALPAAEKKVALRLGAGVHEHIIKSPEYSYPCIEVISCLAGKGNALLALADMLAIPREATLAVGDDINDIDMLTKAGLAVAMGNASPLVKSHADYVTLPNTADGLADLVEKVLTGAI